MLIIYLLVSLYYKLKQNIMSGIKSFLDTDLYKFTMMYAVLTNKDLSNLKVRYNFFNRNDTKFPEGFDLDRKSVV